MIVCHCARVSDVEIHATIDWMRASDPQALITAGKIYRALGKSPDCGGCMPLFLAAMQDNANLGVVSQARPFRLPEQRKPAHEG